MAAMQALAAERNLSAKIKSLFAAEIVNASENRPALHWALRGGGKGIPAIEAMNREAEKAAGHSPARAAWASRSRPSSTSASAAPTSARA